MLIKLATAVAFVVLGWAAWPSRRVRERGRQAALVSLVLSTLGAVSLGLLQLARPELAAWSNGPAVQTWLDQQWTDVQSVPRSVWWLLGLGTVLVGMVQSLSAMSPPRATSRPITPPVTTGSRPVIKTVPVGRSELQRALDAMSQAHEASRPASSRERRVEDLLVPR